MTTAEQFLEAPRLPRAPAAPVTTTAQAAPSQAAAAPSGLWTTGLLAAAAWVALGLLTLLWPNKEAGFTDWAFTREFGVAALVVAALLLAISVLGARAGRVARALRPAGQWLVALAVVLALWETFTAKLGLLPSPFFAPPQSLIDVVHEDWQRLGLSTAYSLRLLANGFVLGALVGFGTGVAVGWSRIAGYWVHPLLRFLGPVPASALLPLAFFFAPSSYSAAVFLVGLATFFPVAVLTWSGVASVGKSYYDVARTLGASERFLVLRGDSGGSAAGVRRALHGAGRLFLGADHRRDDGRESRPGLVSAMGARLGRLRQHVRGAVRHGGAVLGPDHAAVQGARPRAVVAERNRQMVSTLTSPSASQAAATGGAHIGIQGVSHWFEVSGGVLQVLDGIDLQVRPGEFVALLGPSGCGKSTLLRLVAGLEPATTGSITQDGAPITRPDPSRIVVFQDPTLYPWRSVWDNVALGLQARGVLKAQRGRVDEALRLVGLTDFAKAFPHQLSGGMAQRVALARALVNDPQLLVLDEPLGKLDSLTRIAMQSELVNLWQRAGFSALLVTHDVEEALFLANRVIVLSDRPARIAAELVVDLPYPRHRGDPRLAELRHVALKHLGLDATW